jgi:hypothetical protein
VGALRPRNERLNATKLHERGFDGVLDRNGFLVGDALSAAFPGVGRLRHQQISAL